MRRVVVITSKGESLEDTDVEEHALVAAVIPWLQVLPDAGIYIDGQLVTEDVRQAMKAAAGAQALAAAPLPEPARLREYGDILKQSFGDLHQGYVQLGREMQEWTRRSGEVLIERERQLADEAARQRKLTSQSLADIDLLGRSAKTVQLQEAIARSGTNQPRARRERSPGWMDLLGGLLRAVAGEK